MTSRSRPHSYHVCCSSSRLASGNHVCLILPCMVQAMTSGERSGHIAQWFMLDRHIVVQRYAGNRALPSSIRWTGLVQYTTWQDEAITNDGIGRPMTDDDSILTFYPATQSVRSGDSADPSAAWHHRHENIVRCSISIESYVPGARSGTVHDSIVSCIVG